MNGLIPSDEERARLFDDLRRTEWTHVREGGRYVVTHLDAFHVGPKEWTPCVRYTTWDGSDGFVRTLADFVANLKRGARVG